MKSKTGIIYQAKRKTNKAKQLKRRQVFAGFQWQRKLGFLLLSLSLVGTLFFLSPILAAKTIQQQAKGFKPLISQKITPQPKKDAHLPLPKEEKEVKKTAARVNSFFLTIEKIGLVGAPVIPYINTDNINEYQQALNQGLVHAKGTALPGEGELVYIFGHSTNYPWHVERINALFYQIEKVEISDLIKIEYNGEHFVYHVFDKKIVKPEEVDLVKQQLDKDVLVLQSCYPPGTTWKRLLLFARPSKFASLLY